MNLPRAGVRSDFRRFKELNFDLDELEANLTALSLGLSIQVGNVENLETVATNLVDAINELLTQIKEKTSYGVVSGLNVTAQDVPNMTVNVAEGTIYMQNGDRFEVDTDVITVDTADTTNARKDIIYVNSTGEITYLAGTAAAEPEAPETPSGSQLLAEIEVAADATAIETENITDKRKLFDDLEKHAVRGFRLDEVPQEQELTATDRGKLFFIEGGAEDADEVYVCIKEDNGDLALKKVAFVVS